MAVHNARTKMSARRQAMRARRRGLNASVAKTKTRGWTVYTDRKGRK